MRASASALVKRRGGRTKRSQPTHSAFCGGSVSLSRSTCGRRKRGQPPCQRWCQTSVDSFKDGVQILVKILRRVAATFCKRLHVRLTFTRNLRVAAIDRRLAVTKGREFFLGGWPRSCPAAKTSIKGSPLVCIDCKTLISKWPLTRFRSTSQIR